MALSGLLSTNRPVQSRLCVIGGCHTALVVGSADSGELTAGRLLMRQLPLAKLVLIVLVMVQVGQRMGR